MEPTDSTPPIHRASRRVFWIAGLLSLLFILLLAASWDGPEYLTDLFWAVAIIGGTALIIFLLRRIFGWLGRRDLFSPAIGFPVAYIVWFGAGFAAMFGEASSTLITYTALALLCYLAGILVVGGKTLFQNHRPAVTNTWSTSRLFSSLAALGVLAVVSYAFIISHIGIPALDPDAAETRLEVANYGSVEAVMFTACWTVLIFLCALLTTGHLTHWQRRISYVVLTLIALMLLSLGSRGYLFIPLLVVLIARHYLRKPFRILTLSLAALIAFMSLSVYGYLRDSTLRTGPSLASKDSISGLAIFPLIYAYLYVSQPVQTLQDITEVIPHNTDYQHGMLTFDPLRTFLPGHHEMSDMFFKDVLGSNFVGGGQPATLLGPLYADFGYIGVLVGLFLAGLLMAHVYLWMLREPTLFRLLIYAWAMQTLLFSLFSTLFPYITTIWIPFFWWILHSAWLRSRRTTHAAIQPQLFGPETA